MSRLEAAAASVVGACILEGGRAMTLACETLDGQIWRVECERVASREDAKVSRQELRAALIVGTNKLADAQQVIVELLEASQADRWVETLQAVKDGLRKIYEALGGEGQPENVKAVVAQAERQMQLKTRASNACARAVEKQFQTKKALEQLLGRIATAPAQADSTCDLVALIDFEITRMIAERQS